MKRTFLFIVPVLIVITLGFLFFGVIQTRIEEQRLKNELTKKAYAFGKSLELIAREIIVNHNYELAHSLVERLRSLEILQGSTIYDKDGNILTSTEMFPTPLLRSKNNFQSILHRRLPESRWVEIRKKPSYLYALPILNNDGQTIGLIELIYDATYILDSLYAFWDRVGITLLSLLVVTLGISLLIHRHIFALPVQHLTEWFLRFQKGDTDVSHQIVGKDELGKLAREVEQVALSLRVARKTVSQKAFRRIQAEDHWSEEKLRDFIHAKLGENAFFVVSNREPYMHVLEEASGTTRCIRPASGVVTAIDPILRACGGMWIAHASGNADDKFVNSKNKLGVPPEDNRYILKRVWITPEENEGYYNGFSNEGLWPLCHSTYTRPIFRENDWQHYRQVNQKFADIIIEELPAKTPFIFIQDYHFTLLPKMIKERRPDAIIAIFWHIPWPNQEIFAICPYQDQILDGMLACDLLGFHVQNHCNNFLETANRLLECRIDGEKFSVIRSGKETLVRAFPISIDGYFSSQNIYEEGKEIRNIQRNLSLDGKIVALGVERIDYTKGIVEKFLAVERFLDKYPEYKNKFVMVQLAAPSRTHIKRYQDLLNEIDDLAQRINRKYSENGWQPIIYLKKQFSTDEIKPYYSMSDVCIVSSLHDGMNLVAKEYISAKGNFPGVLILSKFTGAARELTEAVQINPYSIEEFADAIKFAIELPIEEKRRRMQNMRELIKENNIYRWAANIINDLTALKK